MKQELAITGGKRIVPEQLKAKWPIITESDKKAVMGVLDRGVLWEPMVRRPWACRRTLPATMGANTA